ncbi:MAG: zinc ribbon domain-containing protein [Chloroflexi bacterium]|jgi:putative FmdB family regulatory protein|nr:zinc ribbon domain-containing protein [Chloroflexota bacterium]
MPIYEFFCPKCGREFDLMRLMSQADKPAFCPQCGTQGEKLISAFASKSGFYLGVPEKGAFRKTQKGNSQKASQPTR